MPLRRNIQPRGRAPEPLWESTLRERNGNIQDVARFTSVVRIDIYGSIIAPQYDPKTPAQISDITAPFDVHLARPNCFSKAWRRILGAD